VAVRGSNKTDILAGFVERLKNSADREFDRALGEIAKIGFRLHELIPRRRVGDAGATPPYRHTFH
jgi:2-oxo-4-hydroxy-4-carboxy--5-ureidoimidazoline (OHCU) decarboxylase